MNRFWSTLELGDILLIIFCNDLLIFIDLTTIAAAFVANASVAKPEVIAQNGSE
jgi:hypothetical protein